jgi:hypothetical protein
MERIALRGKVNMRYTFHEEVDEFVDTPFNIESST